MHPALLMRLASWGGGRIVDLYVYMPEARVFFGNPDVGYDRVLRRCANDTKCASGGLLADALFKFGNHMCDPENAVGDAYRVAL